MSAFDFQYTDFGFRAAATAVLDRIAVENAGVLGRMRRFGDRGLEMDLSVRADGWDVTVVGTHGEGNCGTVVLRPTTARTRRLRREGVLRHWVARGLLRREAEALWGARVGYRFELLDHLVEVLNDEGLREAMLAHPGKYGRGSGRGRWCDGPGWRVVERFKLSAPREVALPIWDEVRTYFERGLDMEN